MELFFDSFKRQWTGYGQGDTMKFLLKENLCSKTQFDSMRSEELFSCLLNVNEVEGKILFLLFGSQRLTPEEIAERIGRHRTTVQRGLTHLLNLGLVKRRAEGLARGYIYRYTAIPKEQVKEMMISEMEEWCALVRQKLTMGDNHG